ncbi:hypothetical protein AYI70_g3407 [Smittium culicis]|uniref:Uncharacterized protein n=1 Tax=Smittium culicis TaxID=133412 RepID=A0A1R1Y4A7_9FUNG|nr:hypothetical protein AYI70_g3407 [Smittium culicis]
MTKSRVSEYDRSSPHLSVLTRKSPSILTPQFLLLVVSGYSFDTTENSMSRAAFAVAYRPQLLNACTASKLDVCTSTKSTPISSLLNSLRICEVCITNDTRLILKYSSIPSRSLYSPTFFDKSPIVPEFIITYTLSILSPSIKIPSTTSYINNSLYQTPTFPNSLRLLPNKMKSFFISSPPPKSSFELAAILAANSAPKPDADPKTATNDLIIVIKR